MALEDIVNVIVTIASATVSQKGFGTPLLFGYHNAYSDRVRAYKASSWSTQLATDLGPGYDTHPIYLAAGALMAQNPRPKSFLVGRRSSSETQTVQIAPVVAGKDFVHSFQVEQADGTVETASYTEGLADTIASIVAGLVASVGTLTAPITATDGASHVAIAADAPNVLLSYHSLSPSLQLTEVTTVPVNPAATITNDLDAIWANNSDWYGLCLVSGAPAAIEECADWVESKPVIFVPQTADQEALTSATDDIASRLQTKGYARTMLLYQSRTLEFAGAAWIGKMLPYEPGAATWKFKTLRGVSADKLTANQESIATGKNLAFYSTILGTNIAGEGAAADGTYLDLTQLSDWFAARVKENVFSGLAANAKVPFTDEGGGALIYGGIKSVIELGQRNGSIDTDGESWGIDVPAAAEVPTADRAARRWTGVTAFFRATGAVHSVDTINVYMNI
jgi:hypothetical protein